VSFDSTKCYLCGDSGVEAEIIFREKTKNGVGVINFGLCAFHRTRVIPLVLHTIDDYLYMEQDDIDR